MSTQQSRKKARDSVYKLIYEFLFSGRNPNSRTLSIITSVDIAEEDKDYINAVYFGVIENYDELVEIIAGYSNGFNLDRIYKLDLAALLLATYEMKYMDDIPLSVSISEAVELVKTYSTEKSNSFVNGILSSVYKSLSNE